MFNFLIVLVLCFLFLSNFAIGQSNFSLFFDGQSDYVEFPFADNHDLFEDFSIELWVRFDSIPDGKILSKVIWDNLNDLTSSYSIYFNKIHPYKIHFSTLVGEFPLIEHKAISLLPAVINQWNYIVVTYEEVTYTKKIYINGVLAFEENNTGNILYNGRPLFLGAFKTNTGIVVFPFNGNIDEVRIWQKTLTEYEILYNMINQVSGSESDLVAVWHFNEGIGDTLYDSSIYNINGFINGATWDSGYNNAGIYVYATVTSNVISGSQIIEVDNIVNFSIGDNIILNLGGENEEYNSISNFGSIILETPLQFDHYAGELIVKYVPTSLENDFYVPNKFSLYQNYPNPFNPKTKIKFSIPKAEIVQIKVYDILGKEIQILLNEHKQAGVYEVEFGASNLPSGIYFYRMVSGNYLETKKMILLR